MIGVLHIYLNEDIIQHNISMCIYQIKLLLPPGVTVLLPPGVIVLLPPGVTVLLPPDVNPNAVKIYIYIKYMSLIF